MNTPVVLITGALRGIGRATALSRRLLAAVALLLVTVASSNASNVKPIEVVHIKGAAIDQGSATAGAMSAHARLMRFLFQPVGDANELRGYRVAIVAADGVDGFDLQVPRLFLAERGAAVNVIVPRSLQVLQAASAGALIRPKTQIAVLEPSGEEDTASFDRFVDQVRAQDYDVIYLPGYLGEGSGLSDPNASVFLVEAARAGKPIFAAGNSTDALLEAGLLYRPICSIRDAFDMPALVEALVATLLTRPAPR
jgi:putative intracellular protease/amidase